MRPNTTTVAGPVGSVLPANATTAGVWSSLLTANNSIHMQWILDNQLFHKIRVRKFRTTPHNIYRNGVAIRFLRMAYELKKKKSLRGGENLVTMSFNYCQSRKIWFVQVKRYSIRSELIVHSVCRGAVEQSMDSELTPAQAQRYRGHH